MSAGLLKCQISPGQFSDEYAISAEMFDGEGFSLFAMHDDLVCESFPENRQTVTGMLRVDILDEENGLVLVRLPQRALENGNTVTVRADHVQPIPNSNRQEA